MSLDIEKKLREIEEVVEENNKMLHKIRRREIFNFWFGLIKLLFVLGVFYYGYKFFQPLISQYFDLFSSLRDTVSDAKELKNQLNLGVPNIDLNNLLNK